MNTKPENISNQKGAKGMISQEEGQELNQVTQMRVSQRFAISTEESAELGRSLGELLKSRQCPTSSAKYQKRKTPVTAEDRIKEIVRCCSKRSNYLGDQMPIMEILFRILLAGGNEPMTTDELHRRLSTHLENRAYSRVLPLRWVERMLASKNIYSIGSVNY